MSSDIVRIPDYTALVAAGIEGITSIYATGQGIFGDPLRPGHTIEAAQEAPAGEYSHWSDLPASPGVQWLTQSGTVELTWDVPMRLWLLATDLAVLRKKALPFYDRYLAAFTQDHTLGGLCALATIASFAIGMDPESPGKARWGWLDTHLSVTEEVRY